MGVGVRAVKRYCFGYIDIDIDMEHVTHYILGVIVDNLVTSCNNN